MAPLPSRILAIADWDVLGASLFERAEAAVRGGLRWVCLRAKALEDGECTALGEALRARCREAVLSVNGSLVAAAALGAGVHLPSHGHDLAAVRARLPDRLLGVSCHRREDLEAAARGGADYALLSPLFSPVSKPSRGQELGPDRFRSEREGVTIPVLALGGVTPERLGEAARAGASGAAVLGSLFLADDVEARAKQYARVAEEVFGL